MSRYQTLIIGAGLSGLAAGIRLAYYDHRVCVLERHTTIGGLNSFYRLRHRDYDVGLHAVTNYVKPGTKTGPLSKVVRQLRMKWEQFALCPQFGSRVSFPGAALRFDNDPKLLEQEVADRFPREIDGFRRLSAEIARFSDVELEQLTGSGRAYLRGYISDPLLEQMLLCPIFFYGSARPNDVDLKQLVILFRALYHEGFGRPYDGVRPILKHLVKQYRGLGGELRLRSGVREIRHDGGRAIGVVLDDGTELEADQVISSAGFLETMRLCGEAVFNALPAEHARPGELTFVETTNTLDRQPVDLGHRDTIHFYNLTDDFRYENPAEPVDLRSGIICSPNNYHYESPLPEGTIRITAIANKDYWMTLSPEAYAQAKQHWYDRLTVEACRVMPDFRPHRIDCDVFTPKTIQRFTGHLNGCVYGAPHKHADGRSPIAGLYISGTDQGYLGIVGAMVSGITVANLHVLTQG